MPDQLTRDPDTVRREIARERQELAEAVEALRVELGGALAVGERVGSRVAVLAPAAFATGFVLSGGIGATMRYLARRSRER